MQDQRLTGTILAALLALGSAAVQAAEISISPGSRNVTVGDTFSLDIVADFSDAATTGGQFDLSYDATVLSLVSFDYDVGFLPLVDSTFVPDYSSGAVTGIGFLREAPGYGTSAVLGSLSFEALQTASGSHIGIQTVTGYEFWDVSDGFMDTPQMFTASGSPSLTYASGSVGVAAVPLPASLWLFLGGAGLLGWRARGARH